MPRFTSDESRLLKIRWSLRLAKPGRSFPGLPFIFFSPLFLEFPLALLTERDLGPDRWYHCTAVIVSGHVPPQLSMSSCVYLNKTRSDSQLVEVGSDVFGLLRPLVPQTN